MKTSICVFIRNNNSGAFGLWESMSILMPLADEFFVLDLGSNDGTYEILKDLASKNKKIRVEQESFPVNPVTGLVDAGSFAELPNKMIPTCKYERVMYYQADEIFHEDLIKLIPNEYNLSFWRYQLSENFQRIKWHPHIVQRFGHRSDFVFADDGMNTKNPTKAKLVSNYDGGWFTRWGAEFSKGRKYRVDGNGNPYIYGNEERVIEDGDYPWNMPTNEMILDISSVGGFLDNVTEKRKLHAPMWRDGETIINIDGVSIDLKVWYQRESKNANWTKTDTPFNIPEVMKYHLGKKRYEVRQDLLDKICN